MALDDEYKVFITLIKLHFNYKDLAWPDVFPYSGKYYYLLQPEFNFQV